MNDCRRIVGASAFIALIAVSSVALAQEVAPRKAVVLDRFDADRVRIQRHLRGVEGELRATDVSHLTPAQRTARMAALDRLHEYWLAGVFPHNDFTRGRTPVFIDDGGRACAMGDLLIHTGFEETARTVSREENLARVVAIESVDLAPWLDAHGLTLAEAQAIQPTYCFTCDDMPDEPVCGGDGNVYRNACVARECAGVFEVELCAADPCECSPGSDAGAEQPDAGPEEPPPTVDDGGCRVGGSGGTAAWLALAGFALLGRRRRAR